MKQKFTFIAVFLLFLFATVHAQTSFSVQYDTVSAAPALGVSTTIEDGITATSGTVTINWRVIASNFPADWISGLAICDNNACYPITSLWSGSASTATLEISNPYSTAGTHAYGGDFHMLGAFSAASTTGCYYMTIRMYNHAVPADTAYETYIVCNNTVTAAPDVPKASGSVVLYPNPTRDEVNILYDPGYNVRNIAVYNIIGKIVAVYRVSDNSSANLDLSNVPSGLYFLRLMNESGEVVVTKKFTKQ